jgi:hypothetical protein
MERRRLAGMKPASLSHHRKIKGVQGGGSLADPTDPSDQSEKPTDQIISPRAIPSVRAAIL